MKKEKKQLANLKIFCLILQHDKKIREDMFGKTYQEEMDYLVKNEKRNKYIRNLVSSLQGNTLVLFQYVEKHGTELKKLIEEKNPERKVFFVYGGTDTETRENIRAITEKERSAIIVASYGTFSTGINIRNLHNIVFSSPSKSRIRVLQSIGRGLRTSSTKNSTVVFDIADDLSHGHWNNFTYNHFQERINIYNEENFPYKIKQFKL